VGEGAERSGRADAGEFGRLILPLMDAAYNLARFLTRDAVAADDIVQEAYLRAWRAFGAYRGGDARVWLLAIVRNCCFSWSHAQRRDGATPVAAEDELADASAETPESLTARAADIERVRSVIDALPEPFRETLVLRELEDLSYRQIAELTGVPLGTVMSRLARARQMLAASLQPAAVLERTP
jgi:RNA polymerase sigma factor (sigma-70 family)